jgi:type II secretory ATPase GspE/PulE/Tfp pilus assembly ATPase PilB-like protein
MRVSTVPTLFGEAVVIRLLDKSVGLMELEDLGMPAATLAKFISVIRKPHGIILATGPTGSGKTTTLYAGLSRITSAERKVITIEDPVEYQLPGANQINVRPNIGLTFAAGLRHIVRQDPDIIMVGEIRDRETADIAIHAALTGHLVFSTLHTNDSAGALTRLLDMGIEPYLVASSVIAVLAQRLVRLICRDCAEPIMLDAEALAELGVEPEQRASFSARRGLGCDRCRSTGYLGRSAVVELLTINEDVRSQVLAKASASQIKQLAAAAGMQTLLADAREKVRQGKTTVEEVLRTCQRDEM